MIDFTILTKIALGGIEKIFFLIFVLLVLIMSFIVAGQVRALNRSVYIRPAHGSAIIQIITYGYVVFILSLFLLALVIL